MEMERVQAKPIVKYSAQNVGAYDAFKRVNNTKELYENEKKDFVKVYQETLIHNPNVGSQKLTDRLIKDVADPKTVEIANQLLKQYQPETLFEKTSKYLNGLLYVPQLTPDQVKTLKSEKFLQQAVLLPGYREAFNQLPAVENAISKIAESSSENYLELMAHMTQPEITRFLETKEKYLDAIHFELLIDEPHYLLPPANCNAVNMSTIRDLREKAQVSGHVVHPFTRKPIRGATPAYDVTLGIIKDHCIVLAKMIPLLEEGKYESFLECYDQEMKQLEQRYGGREETKQALAEWKNYMDILRRSLMQETGYEGLSIAAIKVLIAECRDRGSEVLSWYLSDLSEAPSTENLLDLVMYKHARKMRDELGQASIIRYREKIFNRLERKNELFFDEVHEGYRKLFIEAPKGENPFIEQIEQDTY
jgi:hypothetical protein